MASTLASYLGRRNVVAPAITVSTIQGSSISTAALTLSTLTGSTITSNFMSLSTLTVSSINNAVPGVGGSNITASSITVSTLNLASTIVSIGANTNQTYNNFSNGTFASGSWTTAKSAMTGANKTVQSANGLYQMIVANATSSLFLSSDSGITWSTLSGGLPTLTGSAYWSDGAISANGQYITLSIYGGSLWMSADYGRTFALTNQPTPDIWLPFNGSVTDSMGLSVVTATGSPAYVTLNYPGYTAQAVNLLNTAGSTATRYIQGTWAGATNFTVSFWFNAQTNSSGTIFSSSSGQTQIYLFGNYLYYATMINGSFANAAQTSYVISSNTWYYVSATFLTNGLCSMYVNNTLLGSATNITALSAVSSYYLGCNASISSAFNGYIDDLRITNSVSTYVPIPLLQPNIWMPFENTAGDLGSNAITPTVGGSLSYVPGVVGLNAVNLANTAGGTVTNYIRGAWAGASNFTVSFWFNLQSALFTQQVIFNAYNGAFNVQILGGAITLVIPTGGGTNVSIAAISSIININTWYHVIATFQTNGTCILYVNGVVAGTFTNTQGTGTIPCDMYELSGWVATYTTSGGTATAQGTAFNGYIDDFRFYNAAIPYHILFPQNYRSVALSGTGQYALAAAASGWVVGSSNAGQTWSKQAVNVGTQSDIIQPNKASLAQNSWEQNGVNWASSVSSVLSGTYAAYYAFNGVDGSDNWTSAQTYTNGPYTGSVSTTVIGIGAVNGEWIQIQSSIPLVLQSYRYTCAVYGHVMSKYYIVGSTDATNWYPIQYVVFSSNPFTAWNQPITTSITVNSTGTQSVTAGSTVNLTSTAYASSTTNVYNYFRIIGTETFTGGSYNELCEFYPTFIRPSTFNRPSASLLSLNHTGQYQLVATGSAASSIMPNRTGLTTSTWTQGGVTWGISASSTTNGYPAYNIFDNSISNYWAGANSIVSSSGNTSSFSNTFYTNGSSTSTVAGEWIQITSSVPLVLSSYQVGISNPNNTPKTYYIVGSNDGTTWYDIQYASAAAAPTASNYVLIANSITVNSNSGQTWGSTTLTTTTYTGTTNAYTYFRFIIISVFYASNTIPQYGDLYLNFFNSVSYSSNYGSTWLNTSSVVSNESVALSPSGQYVLSTNSVTPLARLTLDNTNVDAQGVLVPATGAGTVTYSTSIVKVGTHSAQFANVSAGGTPTIYLNYTIPAVLNTPPMITMACWMYPTSISSNVTPMALCNASSWGNHFFINSSGVNFYFNTTNNSGVSITSSTTAPLNIWTHVAMTYTGTVVSLYVNGISVASTNATGYLQVGGGGNLTNVLIGCGITSNNAFAGYVDDVRIYTSALSAHEISTLYNNPALTQTIAVSNSYLPITSYTKPVLPGITANVVDSAVSQTGQYMVAVTSSTTNNVYYSTDYGATFTALTIGSTAMVSCSISYDGSYLTVENATTVYTLNNNTKGYSVSVGNQAGLINQAQNAIAIGNQAGRTNQSANSIILNARGSALDAVAPGFYVAPIATTASSNATSFSILGYGTDSQVTQTGVSVLPGANRSLVLRTDAVMGAIANIQFYTTFANYPDTGPRRTADIIAGYSTYTWGTEYLAFCVNGSTNDAAVQTPERMRIAGSGYVGIGTTNPAYPLHVVGNVNLTGSILYNGVAITTGAGSIWTASAGGVVYYNGGNVSIGTATPLAKLDIRGTAVITSTNNFANAGGYMTSGSLTIGDIGLNYGGGNNWNSNTSGLMLECQDRTEIAVHDSGTRIASLMYYSNNVFTIGRDMGWGSCNVSFTGSVGIGSTSPNAPLQFANTIVNRKIVLWDDGNNDHQFYGFGINNSTLRYQSGAHHVFYAASSATTSTEQMRIASSGYVGIGTASPVALLHIYGTSYSSSSITNISNFNGTPSLILESLSSGANSSLFMGCKSMGGGGGVGITMWRGGSYDTYLQVYTCTSTAGVMGAVTGGPYVANGAASWTNASDMRLKENWKGIDDVLYKLSGLTTGTFQWKDRPDRSRCYGLIAQEVQVHFPEMISADPQGYLGIQYTEMVPVLIKAIQTLQTANTQLESQVTSLSTSMTGLSASYANLLARLEALEAR